MKFIVLILCLFNTMIYSQTNLTDLEKQKLINRLENGDYSVLLPFVKREDTNTFIPLHNSKIVVREQLNKPLVTEPFSFKQVGKTLTYTNQYRFEFVNDKEILWNLDEIKSMPNAVCFGFYDMMKKAFKTKDPQKIIKLYKKYGYSVFELTHTWFMGLSISNFIYFLNLGVSSSIIGENGAEKIFNYLFPILYPTKKQQRIFLLNFPLRYISNNHETENNIIRVPYNRELISILFSAGEEYQCLFKE